MWHVLGCRGLWSNFRPTGGGEQYRLPRDLAGFEPVTICFQHRFKMPREGGGVRVKNHCVGLRPAPPLAEARVSFREKFPLNKLFEHHTANHFQPHLRSLEDHLRANDANGWRSDKALHVPSISLESGNRGIFRKRSQGPDSGGICLDACHVPRVIHVHVDFCMWLMLCQPKRPKSFKRPIGIGFNWSQIFNNHSTVDVYQIHFAHAFQAKNDSAKIIEKQSCLAINQSTFLFIAGRPGRPGRPARCSPTCRWWAPHGRWKRLPGGFGQVKRPRQNGLRWPRPSTPSKCNTG